MSDYSTAEYGINADAGGQSVEATLRLHVGGSNQTKNFFFNQYAWDQMLRGIVKEHLVPRAEAIAAQCNMELSARKLALHLDEPQEVEDGYRAGTEGLEQKQLHQRSYRATVITATDDAMYDNAHNNTLVNNFHLAEHE